MQRRGHIVVLLGLLLPFAGRATLEAQTASISGTVTGTAGPIADAEVKIDAYADKACLDLAGTKEPSPDQKAQLASCRKEKVRTVKTLAAGTFRIADLPPAWYALVITWTATSRPSCGGFDLLSDYLVASYVRTDGTVVITAAGSPFELKTGERLQKDFHCK